MSSRRATVTARLVGVAVIVSVLAALDSALGPRAPLTVDPPSPPPSAPSGSAPTCPAGSLPDEGLCLPVPKAEAILPGEPSHLELLPGRAEDYTRYLTPIAAYPAKPTEVGLGLSIAAPAQTAVTLISLEHQTGAARRLILRGPAPRLLSLHRVSRNGLLRVYLLSYEGLTFDAEAPDADVPVGTPLGRLRPTAGGAALRLHVRQLRRGTDPEQLPLRRLLDDSVSLKCDPRNVLPPKPALRQEDR